MLKKKKINPAYISKHNSISEKQVFQEVFSKTRKMALSWSEKTTSIIKRNIVYPSQ